MFQKSAMNKANIEKTLKNLSSGRFNLFKIYMRSEVLQKQTLIRIIFNDGLTWDLGQFTSRYFNELLQFNLQKKSLKHLLLIKPPHNLADNPKQIEMRRALRKPIQKEIEVTTKKDEKFIGSVTQIIREIAKSDIKAPKNSSKVPAQGSYKR